MATNTQPDASPTSFRAAVREIAATAADATDGHVAIKGKGRWRTDADNPRCKSFSSPVYAAEVTAESDSLTGGWQVILRRFGHTLELFDDPVPREEAFAAAEAEMAAIADAYGTPDDPRHPEAMLDAGP